MSTEANHPRIRRRDLLKGLGLLGGGLLLGGTTMSVTNEIKQAAAKTLILKAADYQQDLESLIRQGLQAYPNVLARVKGGRVVLKPNLVEFYEVHRVNTNPNLVAAAVQAFRALGAREVIVGEGPGHLRDTEALLESSGLGEAMKQVQVPFVDLNLDSIAPVPLIANYTKLNQLYLPKTILEADLVVSMPKMKTHHWVGVTLSMKNLFGVVPGIRYGWPKNILHWQGIPQSIVDINLAVKPGFAIVDGIEAMDGDGPLFGDTVHSGVLVMGDQLPSVDATCARLMKVYPERIEYLRMMLAHGGTLKENHIEQIGEAIAPLQRDFKVLNIQAHIKKPLPFLTRWILGV